MSQRLQGIEEFVAAVEAGSFALNVIRSVSYTHLTLPTTERV